MAMGVKSAMLQEPKRVIPGYPQVIDLFRQGDKSRNLLRMDEQGEEERNLGSMNFGDDDDADCKIARTAATVNTSSSGDGTTDTFAEWK